MGTRLHLKASVDIARFSPANQVILHALKTYGMILADHGSNLFISGAPDSRWNDADLANLRKVAGSNLEVVDAASLQVDPTPGRRAANQAASGTPTNWTSVMDGYVREQLLHIAVAAGEAEVQPDRMDNDFSSGHR